jgi:hypothetical protein
MNSKTAKSKTTTHWTLNRAAMSKGTGPIAGIAKQAAVFRFGVSLEITDCASPSGPALGKAKSSLRVCRTRISKLTGHQPFAPPKVKISIQAA